MAQPSILIKSLLETTREAFYYCMNVLGLKEVLEFIHYDFRRDKLYHPTLNTFPNHPSS